MLKEVRSQIALKLARKIAGGSHKLAFDLYDRYKDLHDPDETQENADYARQSMSRLEVSIKRELVLIVRDENICRLFLGEFPSRLTKRVERVQRRERRKREEELKLAFSYYVLLARWIEHTAQEHRVDFTEDQQMLLFAMQYVTSRNFQNESDEAE